jgi:hypothetical protein
VLAINASRHASHTLTLATASERYSLHARRLQDKTVQLNGRTLTLGVNDELPALEASLTPAGVVRFAPATVTFLAMPTAGNRACQ